MLQIQTDAKELMIRERLEPLERCRWIIKYSQDSAQRREAFFKLSNDEVKAKSKVLV
jgi:hypothetical protein